MSTIIIIKKLFTWYEGWGEKYTNKKGVPRVTTTLVREDLIKDLGAWIEYHPRFHGYPATGKYVMPEELYFEVSRANAINFDFLSVHKLLIVSESMLNFLWEQGFKDGYEIAPIKSVVNKAKKIVETEKKYFALRFVRFDDDLIDYGDEMEVIAETQTMQIKFTLYPNMSVKDNVNKEIFILDKIEVPKSLFFTENIKNNMMKKGFIGPTLYATSELHKAFCD